MLVVDKSRSVSGMPVPYSSSDLLNRKLVVDVIAKYTKEKGRPPIPMEVANEMPRMVSGRDMDIREARHVLERIWPKLESERLVIRANMMFDGRYLDVYKLLPKGEKLAETP